MAYMNSDEYLKYNLLISKILYKYGEIDKTLNNFKGNIQTGDVIKRIDIAQYLDPEIKEGVKLAKVKDDFSTDIVKITGLYARYIKQLCDENNTIIYKAQYVSVAIEGLEKTTDHGRYLGFNLSYFYPETIEYLINLIYNIYNE